MKTTYILLRDNKESGPYSEDGLKTMGLKPDDLIWVEGQSVYWQHPSDFKELQPFINLHPAVQTPPNKEENWEKYTPAPEKKETIPVAPKYTEPEIINEPIYFPEKKKKARAVTLIFRPASQSVALYAGLLVAGIAAGIIIS